MRPSERTWNICAIVSRDQRNSIWIGKGHVHICKWACFFGFFWTRWCLAFASDAAHLLTFCTHYSNTPPVYFLFLQFSDPATLIRVLLSCYASSCNHHLPACQRERIWLVGFLKNKNSGKLWVKNVNCCHRKTDPTYCRCPIFDTPVHLFNKPPSFCSTDEHDAVQKKTFTKWINAQLSKVMWKIVDQLKLMPNPDGEISELKCWN